MRVRAVYWLMLALALGGSVGLRWAAARRVPDDWQPAVYRYPADGMPACADLTGHAAAVLRPAGRWSRVVLPATPQRSLRGCLLREPTPV